jgi:predicted Zn-dependent protease
MMMMWRIGTALAPHNLIKRIGGLALVLTLALGAGCAKNPVTGKRELSLVSSSDELAMGREGHQAIIAEYGIYDDPAVTAYVDSVGHRLARVSHLPNLEWHFTVLDDPVVNAFALPGGYIYITRGILAYLNSEAQLAGVLGHEIGHVTARHSAKQATNQQLAGLGLGLATVFSKTFSRYSQAAQQGLGLMFLKYGRDDENQADQIGVDYSAKAGYDPRAIPGTYHMLARVSEKGGERLPSYLSSHPDPGDRQQRTTQLAAAAAGTREDLMIRSEPYLGHIDGIVYGQNPEQGYFEGTRYVHPQLAFEITFPSGWECGDKKTAVVAVAPEERAAMQLTLAQNATGSPSSYVAELQQSGKVTSANGRAETIHGLPAWVGRLQVTAQDGSPRTLVAAFIQATAGGETRLFQILGQAGDADEQAILTSARSFKRVTDANALNVEPDRVKVVTLPKDGSFGVVVPSLGPQAIDLDETAILNDKQVNDPLQGGSELKIVKSGRSA